MLLRLFLVSCCVLMLGDMLVAQSQRNATGKKQSLGGSKMTDLDSEEEQEAEEKESLKSSPKRVKIGGIEWYVDYDVALKIAQKENKPMWLHFGENPG